MQGLQVAGVAAKLRLDAASAQVLEHFAGMGVQAALLKGASLIGWLYPANVATYTDVDILIRPADEERAIVALKSLGFEPVLDDRAMPEWMREHGSDWQRRVDGVALDLHRRLVGVRLSPEAAWEVLAEDLDAMPIGGYAAPVLGQRARLVHVTLHAAQHGARGGGKGRLHLERALDTFAQEDWAAAAEVAARLDATDAFAAGLRLMAKGASVADDLGLPAVSSVDAVLRATTPPPVALGFEQIAQARSVRARLAIVVRKLFPPREFIVHWRPRSGTSRRQLALGYVLRPVWVLRNAPRGFRAWWRARRHVGRR
jgi:hypothetical protein